MASMIRKVVFTPGQTVATATLNSLSADTTNQNILSAQLNYTGATLDGTAKLQWSNDGVVWTDVTSSSQALAADGGSLFWNIPDVGWANTRMAVTAADANVVTITLGVIIAKMPGG